MDNEQFSAVPSLLGYYFQGMYALITLLDSGDSDQVSIETADDVFLEGAVPTLYQLKHSLNNGGNLTVRNDGLWKTIRIWSSMIRHLESDETLFVFVTTQSIAKDNDLVPLLFIDSDRTELIQAMVGEARRVTDERADAEAQGKKLPYEKKAAGCAAFLELTDSERRTLVQKISIQTDTFTVAEISSIIQDRLKTSVVSSKRKPVAERLIEWWDRRIVLGLLGQDERTISKGELLYKIQELIVQHTDDYLPDDFSDKLPESPDAELGKVMEMQIDLVNGGPSRKSRAAVVRWKARNQRDKWLAEEILAAVDLIHFDKGLMNLWADRHGPMKDDLQGDTPEAQLLKGRELLDWSHNEAFKEVVAPRKNWNQPFLVQGSFQQLADDKHVGWHPEFDTLLPTEEETGNE